MSQSAVQPAPRRPSFWLVASVVSMAAFMEVLDISIANVALQHIAGDLAAGPDEVTWVLTSYLVTNAIVLPLSGWLSTVLGRKRFLLACIAGFSVSSLACGLAPSLAVLICFRAVQGLTGGGLQPVAQAILNDDAQPSQRAMAFALFGMAVVAAPAIGPTLGGWITDNYDWRWVFLINVPVGAVLFFFLSMLISDPPEFAAERERRLRQGIRVDYVGLGLLALGLGCLQVVLDRGQEDDWFGSSFILLMAVASGVGLVLFLVWELLREDPIVDLRLLTNRTFAVANVLMLRPNTSGEQSMNHERTLARTEVCHEQASTESRSPGFTGRRGCGPGGPGRRHGREDQPRHPHHLGRGQPLPPRGRCRTAGVRRHQGRGESPSRVRRRPGCCSRRLRSGSRRVTRTHRSGRPRHP